jgi:hypothetical protein
MIRFSVDIPWEVIEQPGIRSILRAVSLEAPRMVGDVVVVTSAWRESEGVFSWHWAGRALDIRTGILLDQSTTGAVIGPNPKARTAICGEWAMRIRTRLGLEFDVIFGDAQHIDHIHIEHDGVRANRQYRTAVV